ncbi:MAG: hypothetical protein HYY34_05300 [Chloroflexi bacterium]|nr:hypothetical protein [Chloroflexota bacterium]
MSGSPIHSLLEEAGARYGERDGRRLPLHFGDPSREYGAFKTGAAMFDRSHLARIEHGGSDALDLLHRLSTNDLLDMAHGHSRRTIITTGDARIIDVLTVVRRPSQPLLLLAGSGQAGRVLEWLDRYTFGEDSTPRDVTAETAQVTVAGPKAAEVLSTAARLPEVELAAGAHARVTIAGHPVEVVRTDELAGPTLELIVSSALAAEIWRALAHAGATPAGILAYDAHRVAHGLPGYGIELDDRVNPHEANLLPLVSFTKGCYIGQEVVARLDTYDKVRMRLVGVRSDAPLSYGSTLMSDGHAVGEIRTVAGHGLFEGNAALAYARRGFWDPGTVLDLQGGGKATVCAWPLE